MIKLVKLYKEAEITADASIEICIEDVIEFIKYYSTDDDLIMIQTEIDRMTTRDPKPMNVGFEGSLNESMKSEILSLAQRKFTLVELEQKLGTKFDLM